MSLHYSIYQSHALIPETPEAHNSILSACRRRNAPNGITGFLHREARWFLQYLEGPHIALEETMQRIEADPRHKQITRIASGDLQHNRMFPDWQMGFVHDGQMALSDFLDTSGDDLALQVDDPFDLVVFLAANADILRNDVAA